RGVGDLLVPDIKCNQADISFQQPIQIATRGHFDDFESGELSLKYIDDASMRQNLIADDHDHRRELRPVDRPSGISNNFHHLSTFREIPRPLTSLELS